MSLNTICWQWAWYEITDVLNAKAICSIYFDTKDKAKLRKTEKYIKLVTKKINKAKTVGA